MKELLQLEFPTKSIEFLGKKNAVKLKKLSGIQVEEFQKFVNEGVKELPEAERNYALTLWLVQGSVVGGEELTVEDLKQFPLDDMNNLTKEILIYSGLQERETKGND